MTHDYCACCYFRRKSVQWHGIVLCWREQDYSFRQANQPKTSRLNFWQNTSPTLTFTFLYSCQSLTLTSKCTISWKPNTARMCADRENHGCKNLTHEQNMSSKTPNWLQLLGSRFACLLLFQDCKEPKATKPSHERMWGLNLPHAVITLHIRK